MSKRREFSKAVRLTAWQRCKGHCEKCTAKLFPGKYEFHHAKEDTYGGGPTLDNCQVLCIACHGAITRAHSRDIAKSNRVRANHLGIKCKRSGFQTNRDGKFKRRIDGTVVPRERASN